MSQHQPSRGEGEEHHQEPIKYGDVFKVSGELSTKPVAPQDAAMMQAAEARVYGRTKKGGPASAMQQAATFNERAGMVAHTDVSDPAGDQGVTVMVTDIPGARIFTESVGGQVVAQRVERTPVRAGDAGYEARDSAAITIGEALEASAQIVTEKPVDQGDASAAQSAAAHNAQVTSDQEKIKLGEVLKSATTKLSADKAATRQDAEGVVSAELRNDLDLQTHPGGVAASVAAAARLNERYDK
ncbi:hypothetical protein V2J09_018009 [Rumex salicifolius]